MLSRRILILSWIPYIGIYWVIVYELELFYEHRYKSRYIYQLTLWFLTGFIIYIILS